MRNMLLFIARLLFGLIFIFAGVNKLLAWPGSVESLVMTFCNWQVSLEGKVFSNELMQLIVTISPFLMAGAVFLEIVGGLLVILNIKKRLGAFLLLVFMIPTTILFHAFWFEIGEGFQNQMAHFMKNLSIIGALLYFIFEPRPQASKQL